MTTTRITPRLARQSYGMFMDALDTSWRDLAVTFTDTQPGSSTEGRALRHYVPAESYARA